ncbi:hypothetical protein E2C01_032572 [Portunus trituberculatus]|uniref:Uncharacterized protein n=1 Tax=Portunus trituberculatus TaxID=210409 RepID=A0A5B7F1S1_PORTR|nr:hypothetical protein [Portunus trituberculatus]
MLAMLSLTHAPYTSDLISARHNMPLLSLPGTHSQATCIRRFTERNTIAQSFSNSDLFSPTTSPLPSRGQFYHLRTTHLRDVGGRDGGSDDEYIGSC